MRAFRPRRLLVALDERLVFSYLALMATRLLLTLLALLTGLAAQMSPAQARIRADGASEVGVFVAITRNERAAVARPSASAPQIDRRRGQAPCAVVMLRRDADCAPPVMLGIDRARE